MSSFAVTRAFVLLSLAGIACAQTGANLHDTNSFPHDYPGKPSGDFSAEWQDYFLVKNGSLPKVDFPLGRNWAGNIPINRTAHPNNTLFFWAFENSSGSLTQSNDSGVDVPWAIWLNGGPGQSSLAGLLLENGPIRVQPSVNVTQNNFSWDKAVDFIWVDQPVGTGYSTGNVMVANEDDIANDFVNFLRNLVKIFPSLAVRPLLLVGESYAGTFIPYIARALFSIEGPPVQLSTIVIGNGVMSSDALYTALPALSIIETFPQLIGYDPAVYEYFKEQTHLCGYDLNLTYPPNGKLPGVVDPNQSQAAKLNLGLYRGHFKRTLNALVNGIEAPDVGIVRRQVVPSQPEIREREIKKRAWVREMTRTTRKSLNARDLGGRANGTIDPYYGCFLVDELIDYALNFSLPWNTELGEAAWIGDNTEGPYNAYDLADARIPHAGGYVAAYLSDNATRAALHAPTSKEWQLQVNYPFGLHDVPNGMVFMASDPSPRPATFFDELADNATQHGVHFIFYSGNSDGVVPHLSTELFIQNTTFGGSQGFSSRPSTPWYDSSGGFAGIVHQERNWTYILLDSAGHQVATDQPERAFTMFNEFAVLRNRTGLVTDPSSQAIGAETIDLLGKHNVLPAQREITYEVTQSQTSVYVAPSATVDAWNLYFESIVGLPAPIPTETGGDSGANGSKNGIAMMFGGFVWPCIITVILGLVL